MVPMYYLLGILQCLKLLQSSAPNRYEQVISLVESGLVRVVGVLTESHPYVVRMIERQADALISLGIFFILASLLVITKSVI
jgi:hypothetical protein